MVWHGIAAWKQPHNEVRSCQFNIAVLNSSPFKQAAYFLGPKKVAGYMVVNDLAMKFDALNAM